MFEVVWQMMDLSARWVCGLDHRNLTWQYNLKRQTLLNSFGLQKTRTNSREGNKRALTLIENSHFWWTHFLFTVPKKSTQRVNVPKRFQHWSRHRAWRQMMTWILMRSQSDYNNTKNRHERDFETFVDEKSLGSGAYPQRCLPSLSNLFLHQLWWTCRWTHKASSCAWSLTHARQDI